MKRAFLVVLVVLLVAPLVAQEEGLRPTLTEMERLRLQLRVKEAEAAQYKLFIVNQEFKQTQAALQEEIVSLKKPGWIVDPERLIYVPAPPNTPTTLSPAPQEKKP